MRQAVEVKEGVAISPRDYNQASITFTSLFKMYHRLCGMTVRADVCAGVEAGEGALGPWAPTTAASLPWDTTRFPSSTALRGHGTACPGTHRAQRCR